MRDNTIFLILLLLLSACSLKSGHEEKDLATDHFVDCDFKGAIALAEQAIEYAGSDFEVVVPALLIIAKSSEALQRETNAKYAYEKMARMAPGMADAAAAKVVADSFVKRLKQVAPEKVANCKALQL